MTSGGAPFGLSDEAKTWVLDWLTGAGAATGRTDPRPALGDKKTRDDLQMMRRAASALGLADPFFREHAGMAAETSEVGGRHLSNFASYDYLGLNGHPAITAAAKTAIDQYGTSVSASRLVSGERPIHRALETALAGLHGSEDCLALVSGHATNVTVIGHLVGPGDAIVHDALAHNSIIQGARLSGATRMPFAHNDPAALGRALSDVSRRARRTLVVIEGHYGMDGDLPDLAAMIDEARRHRAWIMVDEAHSVGVLGARGRGIAEECGVTPGGVDIWMGTLSKTLVSCGGYIAASRHIVDYLRCSAPGFVYSVGLSGPAAAAAHAALQVMAEEPARIARLRRNARCFLDACCERGLDTGSSVAAAIVPVIVGSSVAAVRAADLLFHRGVNVLPILYPAVPERSARLRFFITARHDPTQLRDAAALTDDAIRDARAAPVSITDLAARIRE